MSAQKIVNKASFVDYLRYEQARTRESRVQFEEICQKVQGAPQSTHDHHRRSA